MIGLTAQIEAAIEKRHVRYVDLFRVDLGTYGATTYVYRWSDRAIPAALTFDSENYEARVTRDSADKLPRSKDGKIEIVVANHDGLVTDLLDAGVDLAGGRLSVVRMFPDLAPAVNHVGDWTTPYWHGRISQLKELTTDRAVCVVEFGYLDLSRRFGRLYGQSCAHVFADGFYCPYNPGAGYGRPNAVDSGTATGGSATTLARTGYDFAAAGVEIGHHVFATNGTSAASGVVTDVAVGTLTVASWAHGTPANGWSYQVGPAYADCRYTLEQCEARGMYGPSDNVADTQLNFSRRRYFGGWTEPVRKSVDWRIRKNVFKYEKGRSFPAANVGVMGEPIPIPVGHCRLRSVEHLAWFPAGQFTHYLFGIGEGRVGRVDPYSIRVAGEPVDNINPNSPHGAVDDGLMLIGFNDFMEGADDSGAVTSGELTEAQRASGVGMRDARAYQFRQTVSTYKNNPWVFNSPGGSGTGPGNVSMMRIRVEADTGEDATLDCVVGRGTMMRVAAGGWTSLPDVAQVCLTALTNRLWGAGLSDAQLDVDSFAALSAHCRTLVPKIQTDWAGNLKSGTIAFGPTDGKAPDGREDAAWVFISMTEDPQRYTGGALTVTVGVQEFERKVTSVVPEISVPELVPLPGGYGYMPDPENGVSFRGGWFFVDQPWDPANSPTRGDAYTLVPSKESAGMVPRYMANGVLNVAEKKLADALDEILRCANAEWFQNLGRIYVAARAQVNTGTLDTPTITDKGDSRNVLTGSVRLEQEGRDSSYNSVRVEFADKAQGFAVQPIVIKDELMQLEQKRRFGEAIRDEVKGAVYLPLVNDLEQAARVGAMIARQRGVRSDGRRNARVHVEMPAHLAMMLQPVVDVCPLDLRGMPAWVQFGRVEKLEEGRTAATTAVEFSVYLHADHSDDPYDFHRDRYPGEVTDSGGRPVRFRIDSAVEELIEDNEGNHQSTVPYTFTLPQ
jgi:hypothetical protein